jgi:crotonobetainyl-CoA:carnitine CoA-transferase CaiB-like acyl-CoA transferase
LNLSRDLDLIPALIENAVEPGSAASWLAVEAWAGQRPIAEIIDRTRLLGLAASALGETVAPTKPWQIRRRAARESELSAQTLVVNLGSLWAGPLAARLLGSTGARIVHVESRSRPDPSREASPSFYMQLRSGHEIRVLDFTRPSELIELLLSADVVIEASRPRALRALGADADTIMSDCRARTWLRITGYPDEHRVGFGDDAAVAAGLVCYDAAGPAFVGDAVADPLTGLLGALAIVGQRSPRHQDTIELNLAEVAAYAKALPTFDGM